MLLGDFVTTEDGTGIVHIAPTFGADDFRMAHKNNVPPLMVMDKNKRRVRWWTKRAAFSASRT